jgi:hypothetical protein
MRRLSRSAPIRLAGKGADGMLDLGWVAFVDWRRLNLEKWCCALDGLQIVRTRLVWLDPE